MNRRRLLGAVAVALVAATVAGGVAFIQRLPPPTAIPSFAVVRAAHRPSEAVLLDRHGEPLHEVRVDDSVRRFDWTPLADVSPAFVESVLRSEDRRFRSHRGVDPTAMAGAFLSAVRGGHRRGGSTIEMQVVSLAAIGAPGRPGRRSAVEKVAQARDALRLASVWTKDEALESYMNLLPFRGEVVGIRAASLCFFGKEPSGLDRMESVILAVLPRAPNASLLAVAGRAEKLARSLGWEMEAGTVAALVADRLAAPYRFPPRIALAPHAARLVDLPAGASVRSSIDAGFQRFATDSLARHLGELAGGNVRDGAVIAVENRSGEILCYVGSVAGSAAPEVDMARARRQAGSTLKPFLYGRAIERRLLTAASLMNDSPLDVGTALGVYAPANYDRAFRGAVSVRPALASSLNVPAVRTLSLVGVDDFAARLAAFGLPVAREPDDYGASLALGSIDVSLRDLVVAYRALARGGIVGGLTLLPGGTPDRPDRRAMGKEATFVVADILSDRTARAGTFGLSNPLALPFPVAAKTGTSKDMRDNWCVGFTDRFTVGVWVGNASGEPMRDVSGVSGAAPVFAEVMARLHAGAMPKVPVPPSGVVRVKVAFAGNGEPPRDEWFVAGTEPIAMTLAAAERPARIAYPVDGEVVALDPDIPRLRQALLFEAEGRVKGGAFRVDGTIHSPADDPAPWFPTGGPHLLELLSADGAVVDEVRIEVRGG